MPDQIQKAFGELQKRESRRQFLPMLIFRRTRFGICRPTRASANILTKFMGIPRSLIADAGRNRGLRNYPEPAGFFIKLAGKEQGRGQIRKRCGQKRGKRCAPEKAWDLALGKGGERRQGHESKTGHRYWSFGSTKKRRQSASQIELSAFSFSLDSSERIT